MRTWDFPRMHPSRGSHVTRYPTSTQYPIGLCYLHALTTEGRPRRCHRRSCPCLGGTTMRTLHAAATRSSGSAVEYSHGVTWCERSEEVLCVPHGVYSVYSHWVLRVLTLGTLSARRGHSLKSSSVLSVLDFGKRRDRKGCAMY
jgi:hypothetical protein